MNKSAARTPAPSKKQQPEFDPRELDDLILTPAVGSGVGSHLVSSTDPSHFKTTDPILNRTTVGTIWITETGEPIAQSRVKPIQQASDVLNSTEQAVYEALWNHPQATPAGDSRLAQAGYQHLMNRTNLSKKTVQRVIDRLTAKNFISIAKPADVYGRAATVYRVLSFPAVLGELNRQGRKHTARIGPGVVYAHPLRPAS